MLKVIFYFMYVTKQKYIDGVCDLFLCNGLWVKQMTKTMGTKPCGAVPRYPHQN